MPMTNTLDNIRIELEEECLTFYISDEDLDALPEGEDFPTSDMKIFVEDFLNQAGRTMTETRTEPCKDMGFTYRVFFTPPMEFEEAEEWFEKLGLT
jgi:hypothetical protein